MPKLKAAHAKVVEDADPIGGFTIAPPGKYLAKLVKVEERETSNGNYPSWNCTFGKLRSLATGEEFPGSVFYWMTLPRPKPKNISGKELEDYNKSQRLDRGKLHAFFLGFGYTADSDTDEIIESEADCVLQLGVEVQRQGKRAGQEQNTIVAILPVDDEDSDGLDEFAAKDAGADTDDVDDEEDDF